jgi:hypothetical protein
VASALATITPSSGAGDDREVAQAMEMVRTLEQTFAERNSLYRYVDDVLYGRINYAPPKNFRKLTAPRHNPLAVYFTNTITAALTVDPPFTKFPVTGTSSAAEVNATLREHFFDASWARQEEEAETPIFRRFTHSVVCKGEGALKTVPRSKMAWSTYTAYAKTLTDRLTDGDLKKLSIDEKDRLYSSKTEEYKRTLAPYPIKSIDVLIDTLMYWKGEDGHTLIVEHKSVPYLEALVKYGQALDRDGRVVPQGMGQALPVDEWRSCISGGTHLTMSEVWTWDRCRYILTGPGQQAATSPGGQGTLARSFRHRYGDPVTKSLWGPYAIAQGATTASRLPEHAGLGVLYGYLDLLVLLDKMLGVQEINAVLTGLAAYKRNRPPGTGLPTDSEYGEDGRQSARQPVTVEPGAILPDDIGPVEQPRGGEALPLFVDQIKEFLGQILPKVLQGAVDTTDSGYQLALAARLGRIAFDPLVSNIRRAKARQTGIESRLIAEEIGETVYAQGVPVAKPGQRKSPGAGVLAIGPDDLGDNHTYKCDLNPEDKASELTDVRKHRELMDGGLESRTTAQEALGINPEEEEIKMQVERYKAKDETMVALDQRVAQKLGQLDQRAVQAGDAALAGAGVQAAPQPGSALGGMGQVFEGGQNLPIQPGGPDTPALAGGMQPQPGGLPASIPGQPVTPPVPQQVNPNPAMAGIGVVGG